MRLTLNGKLPSKEELIGDELIAQMIEDAKAEAKTEAMKDVPTKESIVQALTVEDIPESIKTEMTKDAPTKESLVQSLTEADIPDTIKQKIIEDAKVLPPVIENAIKQFVNASNPSGTITKDETKPVSQTVQFYRQLGSR